MSIVVNEDTIYSALMEMQKNNTHSIQAATSFLLYSMEDAVNLLLFFTMLSKPYSTYERQLCALFCRRMILRYYSKFDTDSKQNLKSSSLQLLASETTASVRRGVCGIISAISNFEFQNGSWDDIKVIIMTGIQHSDYHIRESAILLLFSIGTSASRVFSEEELNSLLQRGLSDTSYDVVAMSVKAYGFIITHLLVEQNSLIIKATTHQCVDLIKTLYDRHDVDLLFIILHSIIDIVNVHKLPGPDAIACLTLCLQIFSLSTESFAVRNCAGNYIMKTVEHYAENISNANLLNSIAEVVLHCLSEGANDNSTEEEEAPCLVCEMILDTIASTFPDDFIMEVIAEPAFTLILSTNWIERRSSLTALLVIMEYTSDCFRPILHHILPMMHPLLKDPVLAVRRKAAYFFSECADYCEMAFLDGAPWIMDDIQDMLNGDDEFDALSALYILETLTTSVIDIDQEMGFNLVNMLMNMVSTASLIRTKSLALTCITSIIERLGNDLSALIPLLTELIYQIITTPLTDDAVDLHGHAVEQLSIILRMFSFNTMGDHLDHIIDQLFQYIGVDLSFDSFIFPFLLEVVIVGQRDKSPRLPSLLILLNRFIPILEDLVFNCSEYVGANIPLVEHEFGSLGDTFEMPSNQYNVVVVDSGRVERKAAALDTLMRLYEVKARQGEISAASQEQLMSCLVSLCRHSSKTIRHHANKAVIVMIRMLHEEEIRVNSVLTNTGVTLRYALIILHLLRTSLNDEKEEDITMDHLYVLDVISMLLAIPFYEVGIPILLSILKDVFDYDLPPQSAFIDDESFTPTSDFCPIYVCALSLLETFLMSYQSMKHIITNNTLPSLWAIIRIQLNTNTEGRFLAVIIHYTSQLLEFTQQDAQYIVDDLMCILPHALQQQNESCRAESCRALGWLCQVFPDAMNSHINTMMDYILNAMKKHDGDEGTAVDAATGALNRILKNIMDSPKQALFVHVLENVPPTQDDTDAESIYKTILDMYNNKGELFQQFAQPLIAALIRSLIHGNILSDSIKKRIKDCLVSMNQEDASSFYSIVSSMGQDVTTFMITLFSV